MKAHRALGANRALRPRDRGILLLGYLLTLFSLSGFASESAQLPALRAAYLYNFAQLVEWPAATLSSPSAPFLVCLLGVSAENRRAMAGLEARRYQGHRIEVRDIASPSAADACHILYTDEVNRLSARRIARALSTAPVLTVDSATGAAADGFGIEFISSDGRLRWILNLAAIRTANLRVSSKLIEISLRVVGEEG